METLKNCFTCRCRVCLKKVVIDNPKPTQKIGDFFIFIFIFFRPTDPSDFEKYPCSRKLNWSGLRCQLASRHDRFVAKAQVVAKRQKLGVRLPYSQVYDRFFRLSLSGDNEKNDCYKKHITSVILKHNYSYLNFVSLSFKLIQHLLFPSQVL